MTLDSFLAPEMRAHTGPASIRLGFGVWVGAGAIFLSGVAVGDHGRHRRRCCDGQGCAALHRCSCVSAA